MNELTDIQLLVEIKAAFERCPKDDDIEIYLARALIAADRAQRQAVQEPVNDGDVMEYCSNNPNASLHEAVLALTAAPQPAQVPDGYKLVPIQPTDAMIKAGGHVNSEWLNDNAPIGEARYAKPMGGVYTAMLAVAPDYPA